MTGGPGVMLFIGIGACAIAIAVITFLVLGPKPLRLPLERRRPGYTGDGGALARGASAATDAIGGVLLRRGASTDSAYVRAGLKMKQQDFIFLVCIGAVVALAVGLLLGGLPLGLVLAFVVPLGARASLSFLADRRRTAFADQLDDSLQLMASSLRAGHSLLQALDSVAREAEEPTSEEFARVINETRLGRELNAALEETAQRMGSQDFVWVTQAVAINREVGGNLAEVLDGVGHTIRERNEIRRQVKALAAEGKLSAYVLIALPVCIVGFLAVVNPSYIGTLLQSVFGYGLVFAAVVLLIVGSIWMRKVVRIKF